MPGPVRQPLPELIAHRGMPRRHRENTLPGFAAATAAGADGWELDVHGTRDGVVVVHHDPALPAISGSFAGRRIAELDWSEIAEVPVGAAGETIPTLDAVLDLARGVAVYVEVKAAGIEAAVRDCLLHHPAAKTAVHSFDHRIARAIARSAATDGVSIPVGILTDSYLIDAPHALTSAGARDYWPHREMVDQALVDAIHATGGRVVVWTVNDSADARRLAALGVDALCSDIVDEIRAALTH
jgi:glycerophosphoryl diester phosphodiesterase